MNIEEIKLIEQYFNDGMTIRNISKLLKRAPISISKILKEKGYKVIPINKVKHFDETKFDNIDNEEKAY